jgi:hypothetical protein
LAKLPENPANIALSGQKGLLINGSASNSQLSWGEQAYNILSQYQAILDIAAYLSLNKLFGSSQEGSANQFRPASAERALLIIEAFWSNPEVGEGHGGIPAKISHV